MNTIQHAVMMSAANEYACTQATVHLKIFVSIAACRAELAKAGGFVVTLSRLWRFLLRFKLS